MEPNLADALKERLRAQFEREGHTWGAGRPQRPEKKSKAGAPVDLNKRTELHLKNAHGLKAFRADSYNAYIQRTSDFLGIFDWIAFGDARTVGVQHTTKPNMAARRRKMLESKGLPIVKSAGWQVLLIGWAKNAKGLWEATEEWL